MSNYKKFNNKAESISSDWDKISYTNADGLVKILNRSWALIREMLGTIENQEKLIMKPINNFRNHRTLRYDEQLTIFVVKHSIRPEIYLLNSSEVKRILPLSIEATNIGEPYRELVRFNFRNEGEEDYIKVDPNDLQDLVNMLKSIRLELPIPEEFNKFLDSYDDN